MIFAEKNNMSRIRAYTLFCLLLIPGVVGCRKEKPPTPPKPKTIEDYILQMVGTHRMVGQYEYLAPPPVNYTLVMEDENWVIELQTSTSITVNEPITGKTTFVYTYNDTSNQYMKFVRDPVLHLNGDAIYFYYIADSITYFGYDKSSMTTYERNLHSVK